MGDSSGQPPNTKQTLDVDNVDEEEAKSFDAAADELFPDENPVWADKSLLQIDRMVDGKRIVGRDDQLNWLSRKLSPALEGMSPENVVIYGRTGTGKSLVAKYVSQLVLWKSKDTEKNVGAVFVDCTEDDTETAVIRYIAQELNEPEETEISIPDSGISSDLYKKRLWEVLDEVGYDSVILILDELDRNKDDSELLGTLSRAGEIQKTSTKLGLVIISNKLQWAEGLNKRSNSSLQQARMKYPPYDAGQTRQILHAREDAFKEGVLTNDVIPLAAAFAANEHGDARRAMDILRNAGELAVEAGDDYVGEEHVRNANNAAEKDEVAEVVGGESPQMQLLLYAISLLSIHVERGASRGYRTGEVYGVYSFLCDQWNSDQLSERRVRGILDELAYNEFTRSEMRYRGRGKGRSRYHRLLYKPELVKEVIIEDSERFVLEGFDEGMIASVVQAQASD